MRRTIAPIPHGFPSSDRWVQKTEIRQLNGYDEQALAAIHNDFSPYKTTLLLSRTVTFGDLSEKQNAKEIIRHLTVGDRVALTLQLRKACFGPILNSVLECPACKEQLSLDIPINSLLQPAKQNPQATYQLELDGFSLTVRPLTGIDLEDVAACPGKDNLSEQLLRSCIVTSKPVLPKVLSREFRDALSGKLNEIDPQADIVLNVNCPACNSSFQAPLDIEAYFFQEIESRQSQLEREVHWIAFHYHWGEKDILSLPINKRKRYVELINTTLSGESV
jgi:hypothetical protein